MYFLVIIEKPVKVTIVRSIAEYVSCWVKICVGFFVVDDQLMLI